MPNDIPGRRVLCGVPGQMRAEWGRYTWMTRHCYRSGSLGEREYIRKSLRLSDSRATLIAFERHIWLYPRGWHTRDPRGNMRPFGKVRKKRPVDDSILGRLSVALRGAYRRSEGSGKRYGGS